MKIEHKNFQVSGFKVLDAKEGIIEAIVSVFGNKDSANERVMPGFFKDSIAQKLPKGVWMHDWKTPVAKTLAAEEILAGDGRLPESLKDNGGLYIKGQFNLGTQRGREAFSDLDFGTVDEFSFGYTVQESNQNKETGTRDLVKGTIYEWSPVLVGCNPMTALIGAKDIPGIETEVKSRYLGEYVEASMTMAALRRLDDALFYNVIFDCLWDDATTLEEKITWLTNAFNEFRDIALRTVEAILSSAVGSTTGYSGIDQASEEIKSLWNDPKVAEYKSADVILLTNHLVDGSGYSEFSKAVGDAAKELVVRTKARAAMREKVGRMLSAANISTIETAVSAMDEAGTALRDLLSAASGTEESSLPTEVVEARKLRAESLRLASRMVALERKVYSPVV